MQRIQTREEVVTRERQTEKEGERERMRPEKRTASNDALFQITDVMV